MAQVQIERKIIRLGTPVRNGESLGIEGNVPFVERIEITRSGRGTEILARGIFAYSRSEFSRGLTPKETREMLDEGRKYRPNRLEREH